MDSRSGSGMRKEERGGIHAIGALFEGWSWSGNDIR